MSNIPPRIKKRLREYSMQAHENELKAELEKLAPKFKAWEAGEMGSGDLSDLIYRWANGPCKKLFKRYNGSLPELSVAYAIVYGILDKSSIDAETLESISVAMAIVEGNR